MKKRISIFLMAVLILANVYTQNVIVTADIGVGTPTFFQGISKSGKHIKLRWKKAANANGYVIYKNGKKIKTIKGGKRTKWVDVKVKPDKTYKYRVSAYKKVGDKKVISSKSYQIKVRATDKKSKRVNVANITTAKKKYVLNFNSSKKIKVSIKADKKNKKKALLSKKVVWSSSNEDLATVDQNGKVYANCNMKSGALYIYVRAHNGLTKAIRVEVTNFAKPNKFKNMYIVDAEIKSMVTTYKNDLTEIASYFQFKKPNADVTFDIDDYGGLKKTPNISLDKSIEDKLYKILKNVPVTIAIHKTYLEVQRLVPTSYGTTIAYQIFYGFTDNAEKDFDNGYTYIDIAENWYYQYFERETYNE